MTLAIAMSLMKAPESYEAKIWLDGSGNSFIDQRAHEILQSPGTPLFAASPDPGVISTGCCVDFLLLPTEQVRKVLRRNSLGCNEVPPQRSIGAMEYE